MGNEETKIIVRDEMNLITVRLALNATLYIKHGDTAAIRVAVSECCRQYLETWSRPLRWIAFEETHFARTNNNESELIFRYLTNPNFDHVDEPWAFIAHNGTTATEAPDFRIMGFGQSKINADADGSLSFVCFTVGLDTLHNYDGAQAWMKFLLNCCERLRPVYGYSSPTLIDSADDGVAAAYAKDIYGLAMRYKGVDVDYPLDHSLWLDGMAKSPCWLTILGNDLCFKIGDESKVRSMLQAGAEVIKFEDGVIIRASQLPELGDRNRQEETPGLAAIGRVIAPIQLRWHGGVGDSFDSKFDSHAFTEWMHRFAPPETS